MGGPREAPRAEALPLPGQGWLHQQGGDGLLLSALQLCAGWPHGLRTQLPREQLLAPGRLPPLQGPGEPPPKPHPSSTGPAPSTPTLPSGPAPARAFSAQANLNSTCLPSCCSEQNPEGGPKAPERVSPTPCPWKGSRVIPSKPLPPTTAPPLFQILGIYKQGLKCRGEMELQGCWAEFFGKSYYLGEYSHFGGVIAKE